MKRILIVTGLLLSFLSLSARTIPGDTTVVTTFTFGSPQDAWFVFPSDTVRFEKILMQYTLKCNPAQSPACGEWDYLTYTYLYKNTGLLDSTLINQPVFTVDGSAPDSIMYMNSPSYTYNATWQYSTVHTDTSSLNTYSFGTAGSSSNRPFGASAPVSRCQYLWRASEMSAAGMSAGDITGLQFYLQATGSSLRNLSIRMKSTADDSLTPASLTGSGFITAYSQNTTFLSTGWNSLQLTSPFTWDGSSNVLIEITYDNLTSASDNMIAATPTAFSSGLVNAGSDRSASFHTYGHIEVPLNNALIALDSFVTVTYWAYGTPAFQPQDGTCFEAIDSAGNRILNAHMPWSNSNIYWDAGFSGTAYDRINKPAILTECEGKWNHWAFTKNVATGSMKIYLNGTLWHSGAAKTKRMRDIKAFRIGKGVWSGSQTYEGQMDEFTVFNAELSQSTIQAYMNKAIDAAHPNYGNLALYYNFNDGNYVTAADAAPGGHAPAVLTSVDNPLKSSAELLSHFTQTMLRPDITFEQGVFTSYIDSVLVIDSTMNAPLQIITYTDSIGNPGVATDTLTVWPVYYNNYVYDAAGNATDSSFVSPDSSMLQVYYNWYKKFPQVKRFELARYITPYGNGLSLGSGWTWTFDVSDYRTLLADSVHLAAGNWQELLEMKFLMIKGIPPRDVLDIQNLWTGSFNYGNAADPIENYLTPMVVNIPAGAATTRWKSRVTGHGMDTPENCAEFCPKMHYYKVDGVQRYSKLAWRDNCDLNPLYPQGGTWIYDRSNWCPGAEVWTYDWELTPYATPGGSVTLDHDVQPYVHTGGWDYWQIEDQVVSYSAPNFSLDASLEEIISPSKAQMWLRRNSICTAPVIRIRNTGSTTLTSLTITYGLDGAAPSVFTWSGNLDFMESEEVTLGTFNWAQGAANFTVSLSDPNGGTDQYANNNTMVNKFTYPFVAPSQFVIEFKTNNYPGENQYTLKDDAGNIIHSRIGGSYPANTTFKDTLTLADGCYTFELLDFGEDGLSFWANSAQGSGFIRFKKVTPATVLKSWGGDFGGQVYMQFTVGLTSDIDEFIFTNTATMEVYPNPGDGHVMIDIGLTEKKDGSVEIFDVLGKKVYEHSFEGLTAESIEADLSHLKHGMYFVTLKTGKDLLTKKLMIQ